MDKKKLKKMAQRLTRKGEDIKDSKNLEYRRDIKTIDRLDR